MFLPRVQDVLGDEGPYRVTASFFGDGTCNMGQFYECLNMAALYNLPHIFVVENNLWAIGMSHLRATSCSMGDAEPRIYKKGPPFGVPGALVDGMDVLKVGCRTGGSTWLRLSRCPPHCGTCTCLRHPYCSFIASRTFRCWSATCRVAGWHEP